MRLRLALLLALAALPLLAPTIARADDAATLAEAKARFESGRAAYLAGDYAKAVTEFQAAQQLRPSPILEYNMGLAYEGLGDAPRAIDCYGRYLTQKPDAQNRADVEARIAALQRRLAQAQPQPTPTPPPPTPPATTYPSTPTTNYPSTPTTNYPSTPTNAGPGTTQPGYDPYTGATPPPSQPAPAAPTAKKSNWWLIPVIVGGVVVTVVIIAVIAVAASQPGQPWVYEAPPRALDIPGAGDAIPPQAPALFRF